MPPSKQARSRQARQKDRLAAAAVRKQERQRRRRRAGASALVFMIVIVVLLAVVLNGANTGNDSGKKASSPTTVAPTTPPTTVAALASVKGKPCVAMKDPLPQGEPNFSVQVGPPPTTLVKKDLKVGTGPEVKPGATITADYVGVACSTGKIFDSSVAEGGPQTFPINNTIRGWIDGIPGMRVGGVRVLGIPSTQAYKDKGVARAGIAPDEALWFVVKVNAVK